MPNKTGPRGTQGVQGSQGAQGYQGAAATGTATSLGMKMASTEGSALVNGSLGVVSLNDGYVNITIPSNNSSVIVMVSAQASRTKGPVGSYGIGMLVIDVTGANTRYVDGAARADGTDNAATCIYSLFGVHTLTGLSSGSTDFKIKYWTDSTDWTFSKRRILVIPL